MNVRLLLFARLREVLGIRGETVPLDEGATVARLLQVLASRSPAWQQELQGERVVRVAVNQDMASADTVLHDGDEVALFPPVTGG